MSGEDRGATPAKKTRGDTFSADGGTRGTYVGPSGMREFKSAPTADNSGATPATKADDPVFGYDSGMNMGADEPPASIPSDLEERLERAADYDASTIPPTSTATWVYRDLLREASSALRTLREERDACFTDLEGMRDGSTLAQAMLLARTREAEVRTLREEVQAHQNANIREFVAARDENLLSSQAWQSRAEVAEAEVTRLREALGRLAEAVVLEHSGHGTDAPIRECRRAICARAAEARSLSVKEGEVTGATPACSHPLSHAAIDPCPDCGASDARSDQRDGAR